MRLAPVAARGNTKSVMDATTAGQPNDR
jgi:hypothetical protein